jgi:hypothetical protein
MLWALRRWLRRDSRPPRNRRPARTRRRSRPVGCMIWVIGIFLVLLLLSILFGGFHQGTRASGPAGAAARLTSGGVSVTHPADWLTGPPGRWRAAAP